MSIFDLSISNLRCLWLYLTIYIYLSITGAWRQVVAYHDECDHDIVPEYIEVGFHDYEASCEDHFCNLVEAGIDQTVCSPPPSASTCEEELAQCNVDKVDNAVAVLSKLQSGTIKLVFA